MKTKFSEILTLLLAFVVQFTFAQENTISGTVTDDKGLPLPGVNVVVKSTISGTQTDFDGNYSLQANRGAVLIFSYVGFETKEIAIADSNTINIQLSEDAAQLEEVVVTAQGIKRQKKALGYAVTIIKGEDVAKRPETDVARALSGQIPGVAILGGSGVAGTGTNITIRGFSTITGDNQPLIIVDGVPFSNANNDDRNNNLSTDGSGVNSASRLLDLDPNNIAQLSVLKGLSATVTYGEQGRNGVILITTKSGAGGDLGKKLEVNVSSSYFVEQISALPEYQNTYGGGFQNSGGKAFSNWGAKFTTPYTLVAHPYSGNAYAGVQSGGGDFDTSFPQFAGRTDYEYKPYNSVEKFFNTGYTASNHINVSKASETANFSLGYSNSETKSFVPGSKLRRNNFNLGGSAKLSNKFTFSGSMSYIKTDKQNPSTAASTGSNNVSNGGSGIFANVLYTPRTVDLMGLPYEDAQHRSVYYRTDNSIQNPRWTAVNEIVKEVTDRVFFSMSGKYEFNDWISTTWRTGMDNYNEVSSFSVNRGGIYLPDGLYHEDRNTNRIWDHSLLINMNKDLSQEINLSVDLGANARRNRFTSSRVEYDKQLVYGSFFANNFEEKVATDLFNSQENTFGIYGSAILGYKNWIFLSAAARNDWSSTHESGNNSILYPSASISFIPTSVFSGLKSNNGGLNYLKLRFGYGSSANFAAPYRTRQGINIRARDFLTTDGTAVNTAVSQDPVNLLSRLANPDLKPELVTELEFGIEFKALNNRIGFEGSVYTKEARDQILDQTLDPASGFTVTAINAGKLKTEGIEIGINVTPIRTDNLQWDFILNFDAYESTITELPGGTDAQIITGGPFTNLGNFAVQGQPYNLIMGTVLQRDDAGSPIVGSNGLYLTEDEIAPLADPNPDWHAALINNFSYKGLNFGMQWDYTHGGDMYSATASVLIIRGQAGETDFDRSLSVIAPGVKQDGTPNDIQITSTEMYWRNYGNDEFRIYDATHIRLREVSLSYSLPKKALDNTPFGNITISAIGNNLWFKAFNFPESINFDPSVTSEGVGNSRGFDLLTGPTVKRYGLSVRASF
jgi:TonB-linked SusC/RagA family outer membrane protein